MKFTLVHHLNWKVQCDISSTRKSPSTSSWFLNPNNSPLAPGSTHLSSMKRFVTYLQLGLELNIYSVTKHLNRHLTFIALGKLLQASLSGLLITTNLLREDFLSFNQSAFLHWVLWLRRSRDCESERFQLIFSPNQSSFDTVTGNNAADWMDKILFKTEAIRAQRIRRERGRERVRN